MPDLNFRYLDQALVVPRADGVNLGFQNGDLRLSFIVADPASPGGYVVIQQITVDGTATAEILKWLNINYEMSQLSNPDTENPPD